MTRVEVTDSLRYGFKMFLYLLVVVVLGGGGMALGGVLAAPEVSEITGDPAVPELAGGVVLAVLGLFVWGTGMFGISYKLLTDAVGGGVARNADTLAAGSAVEQTQPQTGPEPEQTEPLGPSPGEQAAEQHGPGRIVPSGADEDSAENTGAVTDSSSGQVPGPTDSQARSDSGQQAVDAVGGTDQQHTQSDSPSGTGQGTPPSTASSGAGPAGPESTSEEEATTHQSAADVVEDSDAPEQPETAAERTARTDTDDWEDTWENVSEESSAEPPAGERGATAGTASDPADERRPPQTSDEGVDEQQETAEPTDTGQSTADRAGEPATEPTVEEGSGPADGTERSAEEIAFGPTPEGESTARVDTDDTDGTIPAYEEIAGEDEAGDGDATDQPADAVGTDSPAGPDSPVSDEPAVDEESADDTDEEEPGNSSSTDPLSDPVDDE